MKNNPHPQFISNDLLFHTPKIENQRWRDWEDGYQAMFDVAKETGDMLMKAWADFRLDLRNLLGKHGIYSDVGWTEQDIVNAFRRLDEKQIDTSKLTLVPDLGAHDRCIAQEQLEHTIKELK